MPKSPFEFMSQGELNTFIRALNHQQHSSPYLNDLITSRVQFFENETLKIRVKNTKNFVINWQVDPSSKLSDLIFSTCLFKLFGKSESIRMDLNGVIIKDMKMTFGDLKVKENDKIKIHFAVYGCNKHERN